MWKVAVTTAGMMILACGGETGQDVTDGDSPSGVDTIHVTASDTIGVQMGETPDVFAFIIDAAFTPAGDIAVLDAQKKVLQIFNPSGEELFTVGRSGSGPGEYQMPLGLAVTSGGFAVSDISGGKIVRYDTNGVFQTEITGFFPSPPVRIRGTSDERFLASHLFMSTDEETGPSASMDFVAFLDNTTPETVFMSYPMDFSGGNIRATANLAFAGGPDGEAYLTEVSDSLFLLAAFSIQGTEIFRIVEDHDRIPLTALELEEDELALSLEIVNGEVTFSTGRQPRTDTNRNIVEELGVDPDGRIWVRMGDRPETYFRVYSSAGELEFIAIPDSTIPDEASFSITPNGILAYDADPVDWPKVYLLRVN